jgi:hypothetical protein
MLSVWFELRFGQKPLLLFAMLGFGVFGFGVLAGLFAVARLLIYGVGQRWVWSIIQTCILLGSIFIAAGLLGEQIAAQRAQLREIQRRLDEQRDDDERDRR